VRVVLSEALYLALLAYLPGLLAAVFLYSLLQGMTGTTMMLTLPRGLLVFVMALVMCVVSAAMAVWKVLRSDPAEVF